MLLALQKKINNPVAMKQVFLLKANKNTPESFSKFWEKHLMKDLSLKSDGHKKSAIFLKMFSTTYNFWRCFTKVPGILL